MVVPPGWNTTLVLAVLLMDGWCVVPDRMIVFILSVFIDPREMSWSEAALALAHL